jgi:hypothetical protein
VTDATVASRQSSLQITDGTNLLVNIDSPTAQTASTTLSYYVQTGYIYRALTTLGVMWGLGNDIKMRAGWKFETNTFLLQAGDNFEAPVFVVEEWINP